jgi:DNA-directed RNA polymerase subunit RPC12/RpoP
VSTGRMRYLVCPKCGDAVAGRLPSGDEERRVKCLHCHERFVFQDGDIKSGLVTYDERSDRWKIAKSV